MKHITAAAVAVLWTSAIIIMTVSAIDHDVYLGGASILVGLTACVPTGYLIVDSIVRRIVTQERSNAVRDICRVVGTADAERHAGVQHLHS